MKGENEIKVSIKCDYENCPCFPEIHTIKEWAELPDKISVLGKWYVFSDYRTDNEVNIPRFKFGDGKTYISKLPFCTASITDYDTEVWDKAAEGKGDYTTSGNGCGFDEQSTGF